MTNQIYNNLISVCHRFTTILIQETEFLQNQDLANALALLPEKQAIADQHQSACDLFSMEDMTASCTPEELIILKQSIDDLHQALIDNKTAVDLAHKIRSSIINKITSAVKDKQAPVCQYTKDARFSTNSSPVSMLALNRQI